MATGDLRGNLERLRMQLTSINYPHPVDAQGSEQETTLISSLFAQGIPSVMLPLLHYALLGYSKYVARYLSASGYELYAKSDSRFMECLMRFFRQEFNYKCSLSLAQIFSRGYAERKLIFVHDVVQMCKRKHNELLKLRREKMNEKVELTRINYDIMTACGPGLSQPKSSQSSQVQRIDHFPFRKLRPWEHTLNLSKNPLKSSKEQGCEHVEASESPSPAMDNGAIKHSQSCTSALKGNNVRDIKKQESTKGKLSPRVKKHVTYHENTSGVRLRTSDGSEEVACNHQDLCNRIIDMAEKLEARFTVLETGVTQAKDTLQEKLVNLEDRIKFLEISKYKTNKSDEASKPPENPSGVISPENCLHRSCNHAKIPVKHHTPVSSYNDDTSRPKCNAHAWSPNHIVDKNGVCVAQNLPKHAIESFAMKLPKDGYTPFSQPQQFVNTRDFIAGVRARFNRTLELLCQESQVFNSAAPSC